MVDTPILQVDLADPEAIKEKLPQIEQIADEKKRIAAAAKSDFETWATLVGKLKTLAGLVIRIHEVSEKAQDAVVRIIEREGRTMRPMDVMTLLTNEGHDVADIAVIRETLQTAANAGRLSRPGQRLYAPIPRRRSSLNLRTGEKAEPMRAVPGAHVGLSGPPPTGKTEAVERVLGSDPSRLWTNAEIRKAIEERGWMSSSDRDAASLASTLSRMVRNRLIHRPERGRYQLAPPTEGGD